MDTSMFSVSITFSPRPFPDSTAVMLALRGRARRSQTGGRSAATRGSEQGLSWV